MKRLKIGLIGDILFKHLSSAAAILPLVLVALFAVVLAFESRLSFNKFGVSFLWSNEWNPVTGKFGALSSIFGTIVSTVIAVLLALPVSFFIAYFLVELAHPLLARFIGSAVELLAAIPSIIYGMWGLFVLAPIMAEYIQPLLAMYLGFIPLFSGPPMGIGMLTAGVSLALMITPFMTAVVRDVFLMTPRSLREAAFSFGATRWEVTYKILARYGRTGIIGGMFIGLGRALGETMAVTFVIGNKHAISASLFSPANTIASTLANEFTEASAPLYLSALTELGLVLFAITFIVNGIAYLLLKRYGSSEEAQI